MYCTLVSLDDAPKNTVKSRAQQKQDQNQNKRKERENDTSAVRGFSTDQRISIQSMNINKKRLEHQKNQTLLVGLSIQESAVARQVESAEARATTRCPKYNKNNVYWKRLDDLVIKHDQLVQSISEKTVALFSTTEEKDDGNEVSDFLNQKSPAKKRKYRQLKEDEDNSCVVFDIEDIGNNKEDEVANVVVRNKKKLADDVDDGDDGGDGGDGDDGVDGDDGDDDKDGDDNKDGEDGDVDNDINNLLTYEVKQEKVTSAKKQKNVSTPSKRVTRKSLSRKS